MTPYAINNGFRASNNGGYFIVNDSDPQYGGGFSQVIDDLTPGNQYELNFEYAWHRKVPKHRLITEDEKTKLLKDLNMLKLNQLLKIDSQDAMAKWVGARPGDVIEITGLDVASGEGKRWRYCLANVYEP